MNVQGYDDLASLIDILARHNADQIVVVEGTVAFFSDGEGVLVYAELEANHVPPHVITQIRSAVDQLVCYEVASWKVIDSPLPTIKVGKAYNHTKCLAIAIRRHDEEVAQCR